MLQPTHKGEKIPQMHQLKSHFILLRYSAEDIHLMSTIINDEHMVWSACGLTELTMRGYREMKTL